MNSVVMMKRLKSLICLEAAIELVIKHDTRLFSDTPMNPLRYPSVMKAIVTRGRQNGVTQRKRKQKETEQ